MPIFTAAEEARVRELLAAMERDVELALVLASEDGRVPGAREVDLPVEPRQLLEELMELGDRLTLRVHDAPAYDVERLPAICVLPEGEDVGLRYYGLPWGYELSSLVGACVEAGRREPRLSAESLAALNSLEATLAVDVFVTPT